MAKNMKLDRNITRISAIISIMVGCLLFVSVSTQADSHSASDVVKNTATAVIERLKAEKEQLDAHPDRIYSLINELVIPHFDFRSMSRWVLGNAWKEASEEQQQRFVEEFKTLLVRTYANALREYSDNEITYYPEQNNSGNSLVVVRTDVQVAGESPVPIHYRMHNGSGDWKVVDVAIDGVSLVTTYRGSFASEIRKTGLDSLIARLVERNQSIELSQ